MTESIWFKIKTRSRGVVEVPISDANGITIDHAEGYPYCYYGDNEGVTDAFNPAFWYTMGSVKPNFPVPAIRDCTENLITYLWVYGYIPNDWWLTLCFNERNHYIG